MRSRYFHKNSAPINMSWNKKRKNRPDFAEHVQFQGKEQRRVRKNTNLGRMLNLIQRVPKLEK